MPLVQLTYASSIADGVNVGDIKTMVAQASKKNESANITGFLCANLKFFMQCLEGERESVSDLYLRIVRDTRHHTVTLIKCSEIEQRVFGDWSMGVITQVDSHKDLIKQYNRDQSFNPYVFQPSDCITFLHQLSHIRKGR
ncbi:MAG: hypothetical protein ACI92E_002271 [Oceanicoccus sp.]|jgi:hypothetical protein